MGYILYMTLSSELQLEALVCRDLWQEHINRSYDSWRQDEMMVHQQTTCVSVHMHICVYKWVSRGLMSAASMISHNFLNNFCV